MILPIVALLLQIAVIPEKPASALPSTEIARAASASEGAKPEGSASDPPDLADTAVATSAPKSRAPEYVDPGSSPDTGKASPEDLPLSPAASLSRSTTVSSGRSHTSHRREWIALAVAQHSAATFDAWSTRRALSTGHAEELNPTLRPFAGNSSLYAAIQLGPLLFDFVGRRMMTSQYGWARHTWWILQVAGTVTSIASGAHNLTIH